MDLTTLTAAILVAIGLLGADAVVHSGSVQVSVAPLPKGTDLSIDEASLEQEFDETLNDITTTPSIVNPPEIRSSADEGLGMAIAEALNVQNVAFALQRQMGYRPDKLRFALFVQNGKLEGLVNGHSHLVGDFQNVITPEKGEAIMPFVQRCALWSASQLAPYSTALYLLEQHAADGDFQNVVALANHSISELPNTPTSPDRALFENILGLVALFKDDTKTARQEFAAAMAADPTDPIPFLNAAFTDLQFDEYQKAVDKMQKLIRLAPPRNKVLLATAYTTWAGALMGLHDMKGAGRLLALAHKINPESSTTLGLWGEEKKAVGDEKEGEHLNHLAKVENASFENYAEVATLYFHLSWRNNEPVKRSKFSNPGIVTFH
jgi:tetratricopeptide (TPR) repeat protein